MMELILQIDLWWNDARNKHFFFFSFFLIFLNLVLIKVSSMIKKTFFVGVQIIILGGKTQCIQA